MQVVEEGFPEFTTFSVCEGTARRTVVCFQQQIVNFTLGEASYGPADQAPSNSGEEVPGGSGAGVSGDIPSGDPGRDDKSAAGAGDSCCQPDGTSSCTRCPVTDGRQSGGKGCPDASSANCEAAVNGGPAGLEGKGSAPCLDEPKALLPVLEEDCDSQEKTRGPVSDSEKYDTSDLLDLGGRDVEYSTMKNKVIRPDEYVKRKESADELNDKLIISNGKREAARRKSSEGRNNRKFSDGRRSKRPDQAVYVPPWKRNDTDKERPQDGDEDEAVPDDQTELVVKEITAAVGGVQIEAPQV